MKRPPWVAWGLVALALGLCWLGFWLPPGDGPVMLSRFFHRRQELLERGRSGPSVRAPVVLPVPERYVVRTREQVARRMAAPDWKTLNRDEQARELLEVLLLSGVDAEYWTMSPDRQRQVADAYVRAFLDPR